MLNFSFLLKTYLFLSVYASWLINYLNLSVFILFLGDLLQHISEYLKSVVNGTFPKAPLEFLCLFPFFFFVTSVLV